MRLKSITLVRPITRGDFAYAEPMDLGGTDRFAEPLVIEAGEHWVSITGELDSITVPVIAVRCAKPAAAEAKPVSSPVQAQPFKKGQR